MKADATDYALNAIVEALHEKKKEYNRLYKSQIDTLSRTHCPKQIVACLRETDRRNRVIEEAVKCYKNELTSAIPDKDKTNLPFMPVVNLPVQSEYDLMEMVGGTVSLNPDCVTDMASNFFRKYLLSSSEALFEIFLRKGTQVVNLRDDVPGALYHAFDIKAHGFVGYGSREKPLNMAEICMLLLFVPNLMINGTRFFTSDSSYLTYETDYPPDGIVISCEGTSPALKRRSNLERSANEITKDMYPTCSFRMK